MIKTPPLEILQTKSWLRKAMVACGCKTPSSLGIDLVISWTKQPDVPAADTDYKLSDDEWDIESACRAYKRGAQSVKSRLSELNHLAHYTEKNPSIEELKTAFYDGPELLFRSFDLPSNFPFNDRSHADSSILDQESTHRLALSIQDWMAAFDKFLATIHLEHVSKVQCQMFARRRLNPITKKMAHTLRKKLPRASRIQPITLIPNAKLEVCTAFNLLVDAAKSDIGRLKGAEVLECAWDHAWFQAWQNYPKHIVEYALTQISGLMPPKIKTKQTSIKRGRLTNHIDEVIKLHESRINQTEIAKRFRVSRQAVSQALQQNKKAT